MIDKFLQVWLVKGEILHRRRELYRLRMAAEMLEEVELPTHTNKLLYTDVHVLRIRKCEDDMALQ